MANSFDLTGTVRAEATGQPVSGTLVVARSDEAPHAEWRTGTDSVGRFRFAALPRGGYTVSARHVGYYPEQRVLWVGCWFGPGDADGVVRVDPASCDSPHQRLDFGLRERPAR